MQRRTRLAAKAMSALAIVSVASLALTACGGGQDAPAEQDGTTPQPTASAEAAGPDAAS